MSADGESLTLLDPLEEWFLTLSSGEQILLFAHSYSGESDETDPYYVFHAITQGTPPGLIEIARFPKSAVAKISSQSWTSASFIGYRGGEPVHDANVLSVVQEGDVVRVVIESQSGERHEFVFLGVSALTQNRASGMLIYALAELNATPPSRRFVFQNWDDDDDSGLEILATGFEQRTLD